MEKENHNLGEDPKTEALRAKAKQEIRKRNRRQILDVLIDNLYVSDIDLIYNIGLNCADHDTLVRFLSETSRIPKQEPDLDAAEFADLFIQTDEELEHECKDFRVREKRKKQLIALIRNTNSTPMIQACIQVLKNQKGEAAA